MKKDLNIKIATKEEELWLKTKEATEQRIKISEDNLIVEKELLKICQEKTKGLD